MPTPRQRVFARTLARSPKRNRRLHFSLSEKRPACFANHPGMWVSIAPRLQASTDDKRHPLRLLGANVRMICSSRCHRTTSVHRGRKIGTSSTDNSATASRRHHQGDGGARRDRTDDLLLAKQALSQLSYGPAPVNPLARAKVGGPGKI
jgi:hypothetical protein